MSKPKAGSAKPSPNRREALATIGGCACAAAAVATVGCSFSDVYSSLSVQTVPFDLADDTFAALREVGQMVAVDADGWRLLLIRRSEDSVIGLDRICPHAFCDMAPDLTGAWENDTLICVCHDSRFGPDGALLQGPAEVGITAHDVRFDPATGKGVIVAGELASDGGVIDTPDAGSGSTPS
jgi:nitrite reductase/ring-hydroxylating ferredoxin subunit